MFSRTKLLISLFNVIFVFGAEGFITKCKQDDNTCILTSAKAAIAHMIAGDPSLGVEALDPIFTEKIEGNFTTLNFAFYKSYLAGLKDCDFTNVQIDLEKTKLHVDLLCPHLDMKGDYNIHGVLITLPVEGTGTYNMKYKNTKVAFDGTLNAVTSPDGNSHLHIKNFKLNPDAGGVVFDFKNLFNGDKDLSDAVHNFANENWAVIAKEFQQPIFDENFKQFVKGINKYLKTISKDIYLQ
ncbi:protein takeout-like [Ostrinia furnacalis]|uniref:protein takeout-like n=1 Tax=Ostrinia furnacalis TaxID=93504 RepID=UPI00103DEC10|nr:protein takeout-like [Ostrinia furnacalis]